MIKKISVFLFSFALLLPITNTLAKAEIVELQKDGKSFGEWKVYCETDLMMDNSHCKIATKFYGRSSVITIEPTAKFVNQLFIVVPQIKPSTFMKIRIDKNDLILSDNAKTSNFGLVMLGDDKKNNLFKQMKKGDFLFFRFNVRNSDKELTVKMNLKDFRKALHYYNSRVFR